MERQRKRELKELNTRAWNGERDVFPVQPSLDSNMKKNTAFIKRLRTAINSAGVSTFLQEVKSLSLHKYLTEIVSACFEGLCKLKTTGEVAAGVEVVSALHQRFGSEDFTCYLGWLLGRGLSTPDKAQLKALASDVREREEKERIARQRILLRVATELWLVGVLKSLEDVTRPEEAGKARDSGKVLDTPKKTGGARSDMGDAEPFPLEVLKDMLSHDREHVNLPLVVLFVKTFAWDVLGSQSAKKEGRKIVNEDGATAPVNGEAGSASSTEEDDGHSKDTPLISSELQQRFRNILKRYLDDVKAHLVRDQKQLLAQSKRNAEAYVKSGEVFEDRQANYEKAVKAQDKLVTSAHTLAEALGEEMPDLSEKDATNGGFESSIGLVKTGEYLRGQGDGAGIWEDEDERRFYESLVDLKDRVPGILLEDSKKKKGDADEQVGKKVEEGAEAKVEAKQGESDDSSTAIANKTVGAQVDALLAGMQELSTKDQVDQFAIDFCFLNSKASRNRLVKAVEEIPKGRTDLLPLYARLIATLGRYLADVPQAIIQYLDDEFRSLQRRKSKEFLGQVRMVNVRYIAELTKFGVVPEHVIFHCLKVSLDEFSRMNIEIIATLLENCGRYLLRNPETSPRMVSFLETLQRKKTAQHLGQQERMLIENAVYYVNPPERAAIQQKERTTLDLFIRKLVYNDLNKKSLEKVIKQIRKLHWEEPEVVALLRKIFIKPGKIRFAHIHLLAVMLGALYRFHMDFALSVIDEVLERITVGLEINDFKYNQRRIAEVKYLGELYIYRLVDSNLVFDTLYKLLNYGHEGYAQPGKISAIDLPDDYFRIRLVNALLETCGMYFEKGNLKKKLDFFLAFLQYYVNIKDPLPMDIEFVVQDLYSSLRPQWKLALNDLPEAGRVFAEACKQNYQAPVTGKAVEPEEPEEPEADPMGSDDARVDDEGARPDSADGEHEDDELSTRADSDSEEHIIVTRPEEQRDPEADAEFDRELAKLMAESVDSRRTDRKPMFDVPLPMRKTVREPTTSTADDSGNEAGMSAAPGSGMMKFALLSKKGNRQQTRSIDLPSDSNFAVAMRTQQEAERAEQQRIKNLVLASDWTDDQQDGEEPSFHYMLGPGSKRTRLVGKGILNKSLKSASGCSGQSQHQTTRDNDAVKNAAAVARAPLATLENGGNTQLGALANESGNTIESLHGPPRMDKSGNTRSKQRARKLQLGDFDWYGKRPTRPSAAPEAPATQVSLDDYVVGKKQNRGRRAGGADGQIMQQKRLNS
ncbi:Up-frameshift suppressor 2 [Teratosphaeria destructans]|uniref:Up-frameshift suppressor 2 n=1 Tax=Teratosphaeria destructans TaxID=418781 RepID=A0A9W7VYV9_9PEZI|nr:Up-frameshift suppressor 2 [Teratosphaeria destructans]